MADARQGSRLLAHLAPGSSQPIHLTVSDLYLGGLHIQNAFLDYNPATDLWTGGGDMQLGDASIHAAPPPPHQGFGIHGNGDFAFGGAEYTFLTPQPLLFSGPPPVTLQEIGVTFALHPTTLSGDATLSVAGGEVTIKGTALVVFGDANEPYTYEPGALQGVGGLQMGSTPITSFAAGISGIVDLNQLPGLPGGMQLGNGYVFYMSPGYFEFAGDVSQDVLGVHADGHVQGQLDLHNGQYNLAGSLSVCADFPVVGTTCAGSLSAAVSSAGIGACGQFLGITGGFTYHWGDSLPSIFGGAFVSCHDELGPVTVVVRPARDIGRAMAARAAGPVGFDLPGGVPSTVVWVRSSSGPPLVTITGPHGQQLGNRTPGKGAVEAGLVVWPEPKLGETLIEIRRPGAGRWTITPLPGSPAITSVSYANSLPPAKIGATVRGRGSALTLRYRLRPRAGQTVTFAERAAGVFHVLGRATADRGSLRFTPAFGPGGRRQIIAMVALGGVPRENVVVARYTAAAPARPIAPAGARVRRVGSGLMVSWSPADRWGCLVVATLSDGQRRLFTMRPNQRSLKIAKLAPGIGARITVSDLGPTGNTSAAAAATVAPT
ncbi:MAG: hypothetical protein JO304_19040, partial [Solirubrobacterales bacterium]|nr:hypothetical protein [Solirubrobacterales bacterium]